jgi:prophage DNA circulation protein
MMSLRFVEPSYKGVKFICEETDSEFGNRLAVHQYPQHNTPYVENMGRKGRVFNLRAYVIGDDWELQRDSLIRACESQKSGQLVHPDLGTFIVACETCRVIESKVNSQRRADFEITFYETGKNPLKSVPTPRIYDSNDEAPYIYMSIGDIFTRVFAIKGMADFLVDEVRAVIGLVFGGGTSKAMATPRSNQAYFKLQSNNFAEPHTIPADVSGYLSSFNEDHCGAGIRLQSTGITIEKQYNSSYGNRINLAGQPTRPNGDSFYVLVPNRIENQTNKVTPATALEKYLDACRVGIDRPAPITPTRVKQHKASIQLELLCKSLSLIEATTAVAYMPFNALTDAVVVWDEINGHFSGLLTLASHVGDDRTRLELLAMQHIFKRDILARSPSLSKSQTITVRQPTPSLVLAYRKYGATGRGVEVAERNQARHPAFMAGSVEMANE